MDYTLIIKDFGKIKEAAIQVSPLTLFVGDNNSGKSYLLSLLWGLHSSCAEILLHNIELLECDEYATFLKYLRDFFESTAPGTQTTFEIKSRMLIPIANELFEMNKDDFVGSIFNDSQVHIGTMQIQDSDMTFLLRITHYSNGACELQFNKIVITWTKIMSAEAFADHFSEDILRLFIGTFHTHNSIYLPAARTGFMLSKGAINQVSRRKAFDGFSPNTQTALEPFTKPILEFLDVLETLSEEPSLKKSAYDYADWVEETMTHGSIVQMDNAAKEIRYVPTGSSQHLTLRTSSAVVTELAPLVLILRNKHYLHDLYYEEPEMCLHPRLQAEMGKLLVRLANSGVNVIATTHSDIIIGHLNNMCRLSSVEDRAAFMEKFSLTEKDLITPEHISIYQLQDCGDTTTVCKIEATENAYEIPTFIDALMNLLEQTTDIQEAQPTQEG